MDNRERQSGGNKWHVTHSYGYTVNYIVSGGETVLTVWECRWEPAALCPSGIEVVGSRHYLLLQDEHQKLQLGISQVFKSNILITVITMNVQYVDMFCQSVRIISTPTTLVFTCHFVFPLLFWNLCSGLCDIGFASYVFPCDCLIHFTCASLSVYLNVLPAGCLCNPSVEVLSHVLSVCLLCMTSLCSWLCGLLEPCLDYCLLCLNHHWLLSLFMDSALLPGIFLSQHVGPPVQYHITMLKYSTNGCSCTSTGIQHAHDI